MLYSLFLIIFAGIPTDHSLDEQISKSYRESYRYEKTQNYSDSIKVLSRVYELYPGTYTVNLRLGWLNYLDGNFSNSLFHYETAKTALPLAIEAQLGMLLPLLAMEKYEEVTALCDQILRVDPYNYYARLRLGKALRLLGTYDLAEKNARIMLTFYPTDVLFLTELALTCSKTDGTEEALAIWSSVLILDPENRAANQVLDSFRE